ncbi:MAG: YkvA family protein [Anaerolineae bacterium]|nr:YkvA family protein [Anaerolineae bacterium]
MRLEDRARALRTEAYALFLAYKDPRVPWYARAFAVCVAAYAFSPVDLVPDFIPVLGYLDDAVLIPLGVRVALKMIPADVMSECRARARASLEGSRPAGWIAAAIVVLLWVLAVGAIVAAIAGKT